MTIDNKTIARILETSTSETTEEDAISNSIDAHQRLTWIRRMYLSGLSEDLQEIMNRLIKIVDDYENESKDEAALCLHNSLKQILTIKEETPQKNALLMLEQALKRKDRFSINAEILLYNLRQNANLSRSELADVFAAYDGTGGSDFAILPEDIKNSQFDMSTLIAKRLGEQPDEESYKRGTGLLLIIASMLGLRKSSINSLINRLFVPCISPFGCHLTGACDTPENAMEYGPGSSNKIGRAHV